jgi:hypothetical protein
MLRVALRFMEFLLAVTVLGIVWGFTGRSLEVMEAGKWLPKHNIAWYGIAVMTYAGIRLLVIALIGMRKAIEDFVESKVTAH